VSTTALARPDVTLEDKYTAETGTVLLSGIQALVRVTLGITRASSVVAQSGDEVLRGQATALASSTTSR
jgi:hypothetical protein